MEKRQKGKPIKSGDRKTVLNVYEYIMKCHPDRNVTFWVKETAKATKTSVRSVYTFRKEKEQGSIVTPRKHPLKVTYRSNRLKKYDGFVIGAIRKIVHSFFRENTPPTLASVLEKVNEDDMLPKLKRSTLWRLLKDVGFCFEKRNRKALLLERNDIIVWRHSYLRKIKQYRREGKRIVYLDETWVNVGQASSKIWKDTTIKTPKDAFLAGLTTGLKDPTQRGPRFVITHAGGEEGFVENAQLVFLAKKGTVDYHDEMDSERFERWFEMQLLPNLQPGSVIVMDNASYHSRKTENLPTTKWRKDDIREWLIGKNITFHEDSLKRELLVEVDKVRHLYSSHVVDDTANRLGYTVLRLPPYHCELNPIELVWSQVKRHVAAHNTKYNVSFMEPLINNGFAAVTNHQWANYCTHVKKIEDHMWKMDDLQDDVEPLVIQLTGSSTEVSSESGVEGTSHAQETAMSGVEELSD